MKKIVFIIAMLLISTSVFSQQKSKDISVLWDYYEQKNWNEVIKYGKDMVGQGDPEVILLVGTAYEFLNDFNNALKYLRKAESEGSPFAAFKIGVIYLIEMENNINKDSAIRHLEICKKLNYSYYDKFKEYSQGMDQSCLLLGQIYLNLGNMEQSKNNFLEAIKAGDKLTSPMYLAENFCEHDKLKALGYHRISAEAGNPDAMRKMGDYFVEGKIIEKDLLEAAKWYENAYFTDGDIEANGKTLFELGKVYEMQYRKTLDKKYLLQSIKWYYKSIEEFPAMQIWGSYEVYFDSIEQIFKPISPLERYFDQGVLDADKYKSYNEWLEKHIALLVKESDVDINIPTAKDADKSTLVLIISNENYEYEQSVSYAGNDGKIFQKYCNLMLGIPYENIHYVSDASLNKMKREIDWIASGTSSQEKVERVIFYYAGHGIPAENMTTTYLLPVDGYSKDETTGLNMSTVYSKLSNINCPVIIFLDACFSGYGRNDNMLMDSRGVAIKAKDPILNGNIIVFSASSGTEPAFPYDSQKHGLFTYYLLKKMQESNGNISLGELSDYISSNVKRTSFDLNRKVQTPTVISSPKLQTRWQDIKL